MRKMLFVLVSATFFLASCGGAPSETAKKAGGELCECLSGVTIDGDSGGLMEAASCMMVLAGNEDYQSLSEKSVKKVMKDECPDALVTFEKLQEMGESM